MLGWQHHIVYKGLVDFVDALKENRNVGLRHFPGPGNTIYERLASDPDTERTFQAAISGISNQAKAAMREAVEAFRGVRCLLDVGGGEGTNANV